MAITRLGWDILSAGSPRLTKLSWITGQVRGGDAFTVLNYICERWNAEVEPINKGDSWGYADNRSVRGYAGIVSEHNAGVAVDINAPKHPLGVAPSKTMTPAQISSVRQIIKDVRGAARWGGEWSRPDAMHVELMGGVDKLAEVAALIRAGQLPGAGVSKPADPAPAEPATGGDASILYCGNAKNDKAKVKRLQAGLKKVFPAYAKFAGNGDGDYGSYTEDVVKEFQRRVGLKPDGVVGKDTIRELADHGINI